MHVISAVLLLLIVRSVLSIKWYYKTQEERGNDCVCMRASILRNSRFALAHMYIYTCTIGMYVVNAYAYILYRPAKSVGSFLRETSTRVGRYNTQCIHLAASRIISDTYVVDNHTGESIRIYRCYFLC